MYNEIADMAKGVGHVSTADMPALIQTQAALMETQRLHPVVPIGVPHGTTKVRYLEIKNKLSNMKCIYVQYVTSKCF